MTSTNSQEDTMYGYPDCTVLSISDNSEPERLLSFNSIVQEIMQEIFKTFGEQDYINEYRNHSIRGNLSKGLGQTYTLLASKVPQKIDSIVEKHIKTDELHQKFAELKELSKSNSGSDVAWRPSHEIRNDVRSIAMREKVRYRNELKSMISKKENKVGESRFFVTKARDQHDKIEKRLKAVNDQLYGMVNKMKENNIADL